MALDLVASGTALAGNQSESSQVQARAIKSDNLGFDRVRMFGIGPKRP